MLKALWIAFVDGLIDNDEKATSSNKHTLCDVLVWLLRLSVDWGTAKVLSQGFNVKIVLLSRATGSFSSGNLPVFDVIGSKAREITRNDIVTIANEESNPWQHRHFRAKTS